MVSCTVPDEWVPGTHTYVCTTNGSGSGRPKNMRIRPNIGIDILISHDSSLSCCKQFIVEVCLCGQQWSHFNDIYCMYNCRKSTGTYTYISTVQERKLTLNLQINFYWHIIINWLGAYYKQWQGQVETVMLGKQHTQYRAMLSVRALRQRTSDYVPTIFCRSIHVVKKPNVNITVAGNRSCRRQLPQTCVELQR